MRLTIKHLGAAALLLAPLAPAQAERIFGLTAGNSIVTFDSATPGTTTSSGSISGLGGDTLLGIDLRPATRTLYSVGTSGNVYAITKNASGRNYTATSVGVATSPSGNAFGLDFNPTVDRIRLISDTNQNLRINPANGVAIVDTPITLNGSSNVDIIGAAYARNRPGLLTTTLYAFDSLSDTLIRSTNANAGTYVTVGALGFDIPVSSQFGFDISGASGIAYASYLNVFGTIDLTTGAATITNFTGDSLTGLTAGAVPEPATWALMIGGFGLVGAAMRRRRPAMLAA